MNLVLDFELSMADAENLKKQLLAALEGDDEVSIDASEVAVVSTTALQIIAAFARDLHKSARVLRWENPSDVFVAEATRLGLSNLLGVGGNYE